MNQAPNFDPLARSYRWMEWLTFGASLWRCRCRLLDELCASRNAVVLGDGDGRFTARLLAVNSDVQVDAVDVSEAMLHALVHHAGSHRDRIRLCLADVREWQPERLRYDLIVTHFFLDCLTTEEVAALAKRLRACCADQTKWIVSEFAVPQGWFGRLIARPLVTSLYLGFRVLTGLRTLRLPQYREALTRSGFILEHEHYSMRGLLVSEMWSLAVQATAPHAR